MTATTGNTMEVEEVSLPMAPMMNGFSLPASKIRYEDLSTNISYINRGVETSSIRLLQRAIAQNVSFRRNATAEFLREAVTALLPESLPTFDAAHQWIDALPPTAVPPSEPAAESEDAMEIVAPTSAEEAMNSALAAAAAAGSSASAYVMPVAYVLPEVEIYLLTLILTTLLRSASLARTTEQSTELVRHFSKLACDASDVIVGRLSSWNRRTLDSFSAKVWFYHSLAYERVNNLEAIRPSLLAAYRTATVRHDATTMAVTMNLLLRNYLAYNLVEQAQALVSRTQALPENASTNQLCRFLLAKGRLQAIQLEYSDAHASLSLAIRKAPQSQAATNEEDSNTPSTETDTSSAPSIATGFNIVAHKLLVLVTLLMGDTPEKSLFRQPELRRPLAAYAALTAAVTAGDVVEYEKVVKTHESIFAADSVSALVARLGHNALKVGLRKISLAYSRLPLTEVATKLRLPGDIESATMAAENVCGQAVAAGVVEASVDYGHGWLLSNEEADVYATSEPQRALARRTNFCLGVRNEAVRSMRYPPAATYSKKGKTEVEPEKSIEEIIRELEDDFLD